MSYPGKDDNRLDEILEELQAKRSPAAQSRPPMSDEEIHRLLREIKGEPEPAEVDMQATQLREEPPAPPPAKPAPVIKPVEPKRNGAAAAQVKMPVRLLPPEAANTPAEALVDEAFRDFFGRTVSLDKAAVEEARRSKKAARKAKRESGQFWRREEEAAESGQLNEAETDAAPAKEIFVRGKAVRPEGAPKNAPLHRQAGVYRPMTPAEIAATNEIPLSKIHSALEAQVKEEAPATRWTPFWKKAIEAQEAEEEARIQKLIGEDGNIDPRLLDPKDLSELAEDEVELVFNNETFAKVVSAGIAAQTAASGEYPEDYNDEPVTTLPPKKGYEYNEEPFAMPEEDEEGIGEFTKQEDADQLKVELKTRKATAALCAVAGLLVAVFSIYATLAPMFNLPLPAVANPARTETGYLMLHTALLAAALIINMQAFAAGLRGLFGAPTADSLPAVAAIAAALQCGALFLTGYNGQSISIFAPVAICSLFFNAAGKLLLMGGVVENFEALNSEGLYAAAYILDSGEARKAAAGLGEKEPVFLVSRPTDLIKGFIKQSFSRHKSEQGAKTMAQVAAVCAFICGGISFYLTKNAAAAVSSFAAAGALGGSFAASFVRALPGRLMQDAAAGVGAVIPGYSAIEQLSGVNIAMLDDADLFPEGTILLHGMKTFEKGRIDLAILYTASVLIAACPPFKSIFMGVIEGRTDMLLPVENLQEEPSEGYVAWLENSRVLVGNRKLMSRYGVEVPSMDYEEKYTKVNREPIYLAVSGKLFGMFVVSHQASEEMLQDLSDLRKSGISLVITGHDFTLSTAIAQRVYGEAAGAIKVLSNEERDVLEPHISYAEESEGVMAHIVGSFSSLLGGLRAAAACAAGERAATLMQTCGVAIGCVFSIVLTVTGGLARVPALALVTMHTAWLLLAMLAAAMKKY